MSVGEVVAAAGGRYLETSRLCQPGQHQDALLMDSMLRTCKLAVRASAPAPGDSTCAPERPWAAYTTMNSARLEQHIAMASQVIDEVVAGLRAREVDLYVLDQAARDGAAPAVVLDQADDVAMRLQGHRTQVEQVGLQLRRVVTSAQAESSPAAEAATVALDSLARVREPLGRAQEVMRELAAGDSQSPTVAADGVEAAREAAVHLRSGRRLMMKVGEMVGLTRATSRDINDVQEPEIWERPDHWSTGVPSHAEPPTGTVPGPNEPARWFSWQVPGERLARGGRPGDRSRPGSGGPVVGAQNR